MIPSIEMHLHQDTLKRLARHKMAE